MVLAILQDQKLSEEIVSNGVWVLLEMLDRPVGVPEQ